ncbi:MAG: hypothetical protein N3A61_08850, partial [Ignavibacteria bacterium]|nr:hypothetical protein [Ignavibacteria bacterium]
PKFLNEEKAYQSILNKLSSNEDVIKLTKDESRRLELQLTENLKMINEKRKKAWFIKKWLYKSLQAQYQGIINNHFKSNR